MTNANDPINHHLTYDQTSGHANGEIEGLTKREYFAAMAMQGFMIGRSYLHADTSEKIAEYSVLQADVLITALNEKQND
jgi:hypothetical protein